MLIILIIILILRQHKASAVPITAPSHESKAELPDLLDSSRTVWGIVWNCLATTFATTWVSVHPNVPFLQENDWSILRRRIFLMFLSLLAPEVMIVWAFKQWRGAVMIRELVNNAPNRPTSGKYVPYKIK